MPIGCVRMSTSHHQPNSALACISALLSQHVSAHARQTNIQHTTPPLPLPRPSQLDVDHTLVSDVLFYSSPTLHRLRPGDLGNLLWSLAQLAHSPGDAWMERLYESCEQLLGELGRDEVPLVLYALARLQVGQWERGGGA